MSHHRTNPAQRPRWKPATVLVGVLAVGMLAAGGVAIAAPPAARPTPTPTHMATSTGLPPGDTPTSPERPQQTQNTAGKHRTSNGGNNGNGNGNGGNQHPTPPATPNPNCSLTVPPAPLSATGLATPYQLTATDPGAGPCHENNDAQSAFVEATILNPATGALSIYRPLVVDGRSTPAVAPVVAPLPPNAVVGIWFGFQGDVLTLRTPPGDQCVNGLRGSLFGQFGYCGAPEFFAAANSAIHAGKITVPPLGTGVDGKPCPTTRDFSVVDQDQSDNLTTSYVAFKDGRTAQDTPATSGMSGTTRLTNASDNGLLVNKIDPVLGCHPFSAPDDTAGGTPATSLALNELQAATDQAAPVATVPPNDPMTRLGDNKTSAAKTNLYRAGADMPPLDPTTDTGAAYCHDLAAVAPQRLALDRHWTAAAPSPDPAAADTLFGFLSQRLATSWTELGCEDLIHQRLPQIPGGN